ncbi:MAG: hypothetical protein R2939_05770 [Kofleriaceae bacterium]
MRSFLPALVLSLTLLACSKATGYGVPCCVTAESCAAVGLTEPTGCAGGLACVEGGCRPAACVIDADCTSPDAPYCADGVCLACDGARGCDASAPSCDLEVGACGGCAGDDDCGGFADRPWCADDGACVGCRDDLDCGADAPVCAGGACRGCAADDECDSGACELTTGACVADAAIVALAPDGDDARPCTAAAPCATLPRALEVRTDARPHVVMAPGSYPHASATLVAAAGRPRVVIHGAGAILTPAGSYTALGIWDHDLDVRGLAVADDFHLALYRVGGTVDALAVAGQLTIIDSELALVAPTVDGGLVRAIRGVLTIDRGVFHHATVELSRAAFDVHDSLFVEGPLAGIRVLIGAGPGAVHRLAHNTFVDNAREAPGVDAQIDCVDVATPMTFLHNVVVADRSAAVGHQLLAGANCELSRSLAYQPAPMAAVAGADNLTQAPGFVDAVFGDFRPAAGSPLVDAAGLGEAFAPDAVDLAGAPRLVGARADLGAYERQADEP